MFAREVNCLARVLLLVRSHEDSATRTFRRGVALVRHFIGKTSRFCETGCMTSPPGIALTFSSLTAAFIFDDSIEYHWITYRLLACPSATRIWAQTTLRLCWLPTSAWQPLAPGIRTGSPREREYREYIGQPTDCPGAMLEYCARTISIC